MKFIHGPRQNQMKRIAIVNQSLCKPEKCNKECIKICPPQKQGKQVIDIEDIGIGKEKEQHKFLTDKRKIAKIVENLCIGCNLCVKSCPFNAIKIVNLPAEVPNNIINRYGVNGFKLYNFPLIKQNTITGIIGQNGIGKTTIIDILSNNIKPNFEQFNRSFSDKEIILKFRGTSLQNYFDDLYKNKLKISIKYQKIKQFVKNYEHMIVEDYIQLYSIQSNEHFNNLNIQLLFGKTLNVLSGGELQKLLCWLIASIDSDVYIFDEPSNFLDIKQRLEISKVIMSLKNVGKYVILIEHDLSIMDYIVDELFIVYGEPSMYGIVSTPLTTLEGINSYLDGYINSQNIRFRKEEFNLKPLNDVFDDSVDYEKMNSYNNCVNYSEDTVTYDGFKLNIPNGSIKLNSLNVILGENGLGKTTFVNWLSKKFTSFSSKEQIPNILKYMKTDGTFPTVFELLEQEIKINLTDALFKSRIIKPLNINNILNNKLNELSGGEMQKIMILLCLGKNADVYLIDEPSANLDIETRLIIIKIIKNFMSYDKCVFIIEHDIMISVSLSQEPYSKILLVSASHLSSNEIKISNISEPMSFGDGINMFLRTLNITMRTSNHNRPRINKYNSRLDNEQKMGGNYYN